MIRGRKRDLWGRSVVVVGALLFLGFIATPDPALALPGHGFLETFGSANQPSFGNPEGMAVDQSNGDLLVIDAGAGTVSRYQADGTPDDFSALGTNVIDGSETPEGSLSFGGSGEVQVAIDNSGGATDGNIYVPQAGAKVVDIFASTGEYVGQLTESSEGVFAEPCGVAVDPAGSVFVNDFSGAIHKYEPGANPPENADNGANFAFEGSCTLAAGAGPTDGFIFAAHFAGSLVKLDSTTGAEVYEVDPGPTTTVSVDPSSGHVYTATETRIAEFDASGAAATVISSTPLASGGNGVAVNGATGNIYVSREGSTEVEVFGPGLVSPEFELKISKTGTGSGTVTSLAPNTGIDCGSECSAEFEEGAEVELEAIAAANSKFTGWTATAGSPGTCTGVVSPCKVTLSEAIELEANFASSEFELKISKTGIGSGTVTSLAPNTGIDCGSECSAEFEEGAEVELEAIAAANSKFTGWTATAGSPGTCTGVVSPCKVTLSEAIELEANFARLPPAVSGLSSIQGSTAGGNTIDIAGTELADASKVEFGTTTVSCPSVECVLESPTQIKVKVPSHAAGPVHVTVTTIGGVSPNTAADEYTYVAPPAVTAVSPAKGPPAGGNLVEITGLRLAGATRVEFGTTVVNAPFAENTDTTIRVNAPAHAAGTVNVRVTTVGGTSGNFPQDDYTYEVPASPPVVNGPAAIPAAVPVPAVKAGTPKVSPSAQFSDGKAALRITCQGSGRCEGTLTLKSGGKVVGRAPYDVAANKSKTIKVKITDNQIKKTLKEGKVVKVKVAGPGMNSTVKVSTGK